MSKKSIQQDTSTNRQIKRRGRRRMRLLPRVDIIYSLGIELGLLTSNEYPVWGRFDR